LTKKKKKKKGKTLRRETQNQKAGASLIVRVIGIPSVVIKILTDTMTTAI